MRKSKNKIRLTVKKHLHKLKKFFRGFTIVELIIVISIIGTLASIILVSVSSYIGKSKDSRIKAEISEISKGAVIYYSNNFTYDGYEDTLSSFDAVQPGSDYEFATDDATAYVVYAKLATSDAYWCTDSTGSKIELENLPDDGVYSCVSGSRSYCSSDLDCNFDNCEACTSGFCQVSCNPLNCEECMLGTGMCASTCSTCQTCSTGMCDTAPSCCGNGTCEISNEENCNSCSEDCGSCFTVCGASLTDYRDSKEYPTVQIGDQCWISENLDYDNGCAAITWVNYSDVGWCGYYTGGPFAYEGLLYQWSAAMNDSAGCNGTGAPPNDDCSLPVQGICPAGWHVPSHYEWFTLERAVCASAPASSTCETNFPYSVSYIGWKGTNEGDKIKNTGLCGGRTPCDTSGFDVLLVGDRDHSGGFYSRGTYTGFWSSTTKTVSDAWIRSLSKTASTIYQNADPMSRAFSVRCVKD